VRTLRRIEWACAEQGEYFRAGPNPLLALGGFNAAKTWSGILKLLRLLDLFPNSRAAIVRSSSRDMRKTTMETFYALCPPSAYNLGRRSDQEGVCQLNNGSLAYFIHLDKPDSLNVLAGLELNFGFPDQAEQITEKAWDVLDARLGRWPHAVVPQHVLDSNSPWPWTNDAGMVVPPPFLFATANPPDSEEHWLFRRFAEDSEEYDRWKAEGYHYIRFRSKDNRFASRANIAKLYSKDKEFVDRYAEGQWVSPGGAIFTIDHQSIVTPYPDLVKRIVNNMNLHRSMDHGDSSPTCVLWEATDHDGNIFIYREYYEADALVSDHRRAIHQLSKGDVPVNSPFKEPRYRSNMADPSIFSLSRGRTSTARPTWSIADEWMDTRIMPEETRVRWLPAPIPRTENDSYELTTRSRLKEYLKVDPNHRNPFTGQLGAPRIYFLKRTEEYPAGCYHVIKEIRGQRRVKIGEREGRAIYSDARDESIPDHAYDTVKYHVISRPSPMRVAERKDPNVINLKELMQWSASNLRKRAGRSGGY
jgi:hypothetical protein